MQAKLNFIHITTTNTSQSLVKIVVYISDKLHMPLVNNPKIQILFLLPTLHQNQCGDECESCPEARAYPYLEQTLLRM